MPPCCKPQPPQKTTTRWPLRLQVVTRSRAEGQATVKGLPPCSPARHRSLQSGLRARGPLPGWIRYEDRLQSTSVSPERQMPRVLVLALLGAFVVREAAAQEPAPRVRALCDRSDPTHFCPGPSCFCV